MAFTTKLNLNDCKFIQADGVNLTLSGDTKIPSIGTIAYVAQPTLSCLQLAYAGFVTGCTDSNLSALKTYTGTTAPAQFVDKGSMDTYSGTTAIAAFVDKSAMDTYSGTTAPQQFTNWNTFDNFTGATCGFIYNAITGVTNGLTKCGSHDAVLGGALTETTVLKGSEIFGVNAATVNLTGSTVSLDGALTFKTFCGCTPNLLCVDISNGAVGVTSLSAFGGITGGTNGLTTCPNYKLGLGGALSADTSICGGSTYDLCLGIPTSKLDCLCMVAKSTCVTSGSLSMVASGETFTDLRSINTCPLGLIYGSDYTNNFCDNSLVSKKYVDTIATGLQVHNSVKVATTVAGGNVNLSAPPSTIDGYTLANMDRVLIKNQTLGYQNGLYNFHGSGFTRTDDFNFSPPSEITNGDMIPVTTGDTNNNSIWVLTTPNPVISGNSLTFTEFATVIDIVGGAGIDITQVGGTHTACVNLGGSEPTSCGLSVAAGGLCIDPNLAGTALSYSAGVISVCAANCGAVGAIPVGYNGAECLVVACSDLLAATNGISGATNGLTNTCHKVCLGGALTTATTICLTTSNPLTFTDNQATPTGVIYGGNYSATYTSRSLVDKAYVTGSTLCANNIAAEAITGVTNGLTKFSCHCACLGGTVNSGTGISITPTGTRTITLGTVSNKFTVNTGCTTIFNQVGTCVNTFGVSDTQIQATVIDTNTSYNAIIGMCSATPAICTAVGNGGTCTVGSCITPNSYIISGCQATFPGAQYLYNFCGNYTNRSIPDAAYVTGQTSSNLSALKTYTGTTAPNTFAYKSSVQTYTGTTAPQQFTNWTTFDNFTGATGVSLTGATNGLSTFGKKVCFGGVLSNSFTTVLAHGTYNTTLQIGATSTNTANYRGGKIVLQRSTGTTANNNVLIAAKSANSDYAQILIDSATGVQLCASLETSGCQRGVTLGTNALLYANNYSSCFVARSIPDVAYVTGCTYAATVYATNGLNKNSGNCIGLGGGLTGNTTITGAYLFGVDVTTINLTGSTVNIGGAVKLTSTPATGLVTDSVLVRATDGTVKVLTTGGNNVYSKTTVAINTLLTTGSTYVILVNSPAAARTITLPAVPINGQAFKIKDVANAALSFNITINPNGANIDGVASNATINTDGGALEIMFDATLDSWYVLSFVN